MAEIRRTLTVTNAQGLHARPCHAIVSASMAHAAEVRLKLGPKEVNGKSILELMTLQASVGSELEVRTWGADAEQLMGKLHELFSDGFGELAS